MQGDEGGEDEARYRAKITMEFEVISGNHLPDVVHSLGSRMVNSFTVKKLESPISHDRITSIEIIELIAEKIPDRINRANR